MARDFDGTGDSINFGSDASIDSLVTMSFGFWLSPDDTATNEGLLTKFSSPNGWYAFQGNGNDFAFGHAWSTAPGVFWDTTVTITGGLVHIACTYDDALTTNDPVEYVNGTADTLTERSGPPSGTVTSDSGNDMIMGSGTVIGAADFDGRIQGFVFTSGIWDAGQVNRHRWYGTPGGAVLVHHPLITDSLTNKGTGTADGTATNTTMASLPRMERMHCATMGCGR